ncbi:MAG: hypothetical protein R3200_12850 [Xanthomonadales bacterium]|nr:hypothetical protein [Xanthomonadales bacterium]
MAVSSFYEQVLELESNLIALETSDVEAALVQYRLICRQTGRSIYHWSDNQGMTSLKAADISVPGCRKLVEALRYIVQSMQYGVYILTRYERELRGPAVDYLRKVAAAEDDRKVILLGQQIALPNSLEKLFHVVGEEQGETEAFRPRLRDGRWVV